MFVHSDGQLRAAHLILDYTPVSKSYQASKCVIKAKDPRLHQINVAAPGFLTTDSILEGALTTDPIPKGIPKVALPLKVVNRSNRAGPAHFYLAHGHNGLGIIGY